MKRLLNLFLVLCLLAVPVFAEELEDMETFGTCGEDMTWAYEDGVLTIEGEGYMDDFEENPRSTAARS